VRGSVAPAQRARQGSGGVITTLAEQLRLRGANLWHLASVSTLTRQLPVGISTLEA
jgi:hypothetical protein